MKKYYDGICIGLALSLALACVAIFVYMLVAHWKWGLGMIGSWLFMMGAMRGVMLLGMWDERRRKKP